MTLTILSPEMAFERNSDKATRIVTNADLRLFINGFGNYTATLYVGRMGVFCVDEPLESELIGTYAGT